MRVRRIIRAEKELPYETWSFDNTRVRFGRDFTLVWMRWQQLKLFEPVDSAERRVVQRNLYGCGEVY